MRLDLGRNREAIEAYREAVKERPRSEAGTFEASVLSHDKRLDEPDNWQHTQTAKAAGVSTATAARAQALVTKRPFLASEVAASSISLTEGLRQAQAVKRASDTAQVER